MSKKPTNMKGTSWVFRLLAGVEWLGNKLPHPFWLFCLLFLVVTALSAMLSGAGVSALRPATQILKTSEDGRWVEGQSFTVGPGFEGFTINLENASRSSRLSNIYVELYSEGRLVHEERIGRSELRALLVTAARLEALLVKQAVSQREVEQARAEAT